MLRLAALTHLIIWTVCALSPTGHLGDFQRYWEIGTIAGSSQAAVPVEYPPGAVLAFGLLARATGGPHGFTLALLGLNLAADVVVGAVLADVWGIGAAAAYGAISAPLVSLLFSRYDLWSVAAALAAVACWMRGRWPRSLLLLAAGVSLKVWPLLLVAWLVGMPVRSWRSVSRWRLCLVALSLGAWGVWILYSGGLIGVLTFRGATGWGIESTVGSVWRVARPESVRLESGAVRAGAIAPWASMALFVIVMPVACWGIYRGVTTKRFGLGWVTGIGALLAVSALLSPQFLAWMMPGAAIAWAEHDRRTTRWLAVLVVVTVVYRVFHTTQMPGLVLARNAILIAMVGDGLRRLWRGLPSKAGEHRAVVRLQAADPPAG